MQKVFHFSTLSHMLLSKYLTVVYVPIWALFTSGRIRYHHWNCRKLNTFVLNCKDMCQLCGGPCVISAKMKHKQSENDGIFSPLTGKLVQQCRDSFVALSINLSSECARPFSLIRSYIRSLPFYWCAPFDHPMPIDVKILEYFMSLNVLKHSGKSVRTVC